MQIIIQIMGSPSGNDALARAIPLVGRSKVFYLSDNGLYIEYASKAKARKALQDAYTSLISEYPNFDMLVLSHDRTKLVYAESIAIIKSI